MLRLTEQWCGYTFKTGYNSCVRSMRLSLDPIETEHHPRLFCFFTSDLIPVFQTL